jgi:hypothetical protein
MAEPSKKSLSEQLDLATQLADQMKFILKLTKEKGELDNLSATLSKEVVKNTQAISKSFESAKDVQKEITKNQDLQNKLALQRETLEKNIGKEGKKAVQFIRNQEAGLAKDTKKLQELRAKGLNDEANKLAKNLISRNKSLATQMQNLSVEEKQYMILGQQSQILSQNLEYLEEELDLQLEIAAEQERRNKNLLKSQSLFTAALSGTSNALNKLGYGDLSRKLGLDDAAEKAKEMTHTLTDGGNKSLGLFGKMRVGVASFGAALKSALGPLAIAGMLVALFNKAREASKASGEFIKKIDQQTQDFGRSLGISGRKAAMITNEARSMGAAMGMTSEMATQSAESIYTALGGAEKVSSKTLNTFMKLNVFAGMSAENLASIYNLSKLTGQPAEKTAEAMASTARESIRANKVNVSMKQVMDGVSKVSATMKLNFGGSAEGLTRAFIQSKKLGLELSKVDEIASSLLNIEDSIAAEMEAELMTGKELNLEKAREAALNNDNATLMSEIANQFGSIEDFQKMNRASQESFAKAIGMSRDGLADMLVSSKENEAKNTDLVDTQQQSLAAMQSQASTAEKMAVQDEARLAAAGNLGKEQLKLEENMKKLELLGTQIVNTFTAPMLEKVVAIVDKVVELIDRFKAARAEGNGIFDSITKVWQATDTFGKVLMGVVGTLTAIKGIMFLINTYQNIRLGVQKLINIEMIKEGAQMIKNGARAALDFAKSVGTAIMKAISSLSSIPVIGFGLGIAAGATIAGLAAKYMNDGVISPSQGKGGYGNRVMYGPEGAISFNNKDTIVAGTNLFGDDVVSGPKESVSMGGGALLQEMKEIKAIMSQILHKEGNVTLDGSKVGKALTLSGYRM